MICVKLLIEFKNKCGKIFVNLKIIEQTFLWSLRDGLKIMVKVHGCQTLIPVVSMSPRKKDAFWVISFLGYKSEFLVFGLGPRETTCTSLCSSFSSKAIS